MFCFPQDSGCLGSQILLFLITIIAAVKIAGGLSGQVFGMGVVMSLMSWLFSPKAIKAAGPCATIFEKLEDRTLMSVTTPPTTPPAAPTNLSASAASATSVSLHWSDNSARETGYAIERSTDGKTFTQIGTVGQNVDAYSSASLSGGRKYYFRVRGYNPYGNSSYTNVATATPASSPTTGTDNTANVEVHGPFYNGVSINTHVDPSLLIPILKNLGVKSVRLWWQMDTWESRGGDAAMSIREAQAYRAAGFNVMMDVDGPEVPTVAQATAFFKYIASQKSALAAVNLWEIVNEPNIADSWEGTASQYVNIVLKSAWDVLHPLGAKIVGGGPSWDVNYAQSMVNAGYLNYCDYAGMHPYGSSVSQVIQRPPPPQRSMPVNP